MTLKIFYEGGDDYTECEAPGTKPFPIELTECKNPGKWRIQDPRSGDAGNIVCDEHKEWLKVRGLAS